MAAAPPDAPPRLCLVHLLERPGGFDAVLHAARGQTSRAFRLVALDTLHAQRAAAVAALARDLGLSLAHEAITLGPAGWELAAAWAVAAPRCAHAALEAVSIVRQSIWLPPSFVLGTLAELERAAAASTRPASARAAASLPLLGYPIYQLEPPSQEVDEAGLSGGAAEGLAQVFSPPLDLTYSRRGWRILRRVLPAAEAGLEGSGAAPLRSGGGGLPPGVWSLRLDLLGKLGRLVPTAPGVAAERCWEAGKLRPPKGVSVRVLIADLSLRCDALDTTDWSPVATWAPNSRLDSIPMGCDRTS